MQSSDTLTTIGDAYHLLVLGFLKQTVHRIMLANPND
jgi:hypothetical protein